MDDNTDCDTAPDQATVDRPYDPPNTRPNSNAGAERIAAFTTESMAAATALQTSLSHVNADQMSIADSFAHAIKSALQAGSRDLLALAEAGPAVDQFLRISKQIDRLVHLDLKLQRHIGELVAAQVFREPAAAKNPESDTHSPNDS